MAAHPPAEAAQAAPRSTRSAQPKHGAKERGLFAWCMSRQLELSGAFLLVTLALNAVTPPESHLSTALTPSPSYHLRSRISRFLFLSFRKPGTDLYFKGRDDAFFITWWVGAFWFLREAFMRGVFGPFARWTGIKQRRAIVRFEEQAWACLYATVSFGIGLYINQTSDYRSLNTLHFWKGYPHDALPAFTKYYYLVQTAFWIQQIIVLNLEARRKDYYQMFAHHIITVILMMFSYVLNWTRIGNTILCTMDLADVFLTLAKLFKYTGKEMASDATFAVFLVTWIATRHVIFGRILWSVVTEPQTVLEYAWRSRDGYYFSHNVQRSFTLLLAALQAIFCMWLFMILRVLWRMVQKGQVEDVRSDDEDDGEEEEEEEEEEAEPATNGHANGVNLERKKDR
ncbi:hypothetical protein JCM10213_002254 [Rhodosporidiobolus nylandii]